tara:strand:+ start:312 stop:1349 length:1038 start_codon:yes stop_codon:yes gene_type:complete
MEHEEREKKFNKTIVKLNGRLEGLVGRLKNDMDKYNKKRNPISSAAPPSCGSMGKNAFNDKSEIRGEDRLDVEDAYDTIDNIIEELGRDKIKFPDGVDLIPKERGEGGSGSGADDAVIEVPFTGRPDWMDEIDAGVGELFSSPTIIRKGIDYESAQTYISQGIFIAKKPKIKGPKDEKEIYILMDQSGSMKGYSYKGMNFITLLSSFIPELAEKYSGYFWGCDSCSIEMYDADPEMVPGLSKSLESFRGKTLRSVPFKGGGGTEFGGAFAKLKGIEQEKRRRNPEYEMTVVFFSDMEFHWENIYDYMPKRVLFITPKSTEHYIDWPFINADPEHRKVILIELEST